MATKKKSAKKTAKTKVVKSPKIAKQKKEVSKGKTLNNKTAPKTAKAKMEEKRPLKKEVIVAPIAPKVPNVKVVAGPKKPEPKGKYTLEYSVRSSVPILFEFISTPSGLSEWFADDVNIKTGGFFTFFWDGIPQQTKMVNYKEDEMVKFIWLDKNDGSYFEFKIQTDELTNDVSLIITDFSDPADLVTNKMLWNNQVNTLLKVIGSYS